MSNWEHFSVSIYICDDPLSRKYGHVGRASKIREMENVSIVQYTCSVQLLNLDSCYHRYSYMDMDTDPGTCE